MKMTIRRFVSLVLCLSFAIMIAIGVLMAYGVIPAADVSHRLEVLGWEYQNGSETRGFLINVFFTLATVNLLSIWLWLIRCAAQGDFLRLGAGLLLGTAIVAALLFLTPSYCSRAP
jgi:hypothetical protein